MIYATTLNKCIIKDTFFDRHVWIAKNEVGKVASIIKNLFVAIQENKATANLADLFYNQDIKSPLIYQQMNLQQLFKK